MTGGGIKGLIEEAKAHGIVSAGDFIQFASDYSKMNEVNDTELSSETDSGKVMSVVALDESRVFIAYKGGTSSSYSLYGCVCTIDGTTITKSTKSKLNTYGFNGSQISIVCLNANKVLVLYDVINSFTICGVVCTISGNIISVGTNTKITSNTSSGKVISAVKLDEGKVFIAHSYGSSYYLYGMVCTISGATITTGTDTQLNETNSTGSAFSAVALSSTKVFISHYYSSAGYMYGIVCTISGTTITKGTDTNLLNLSNSGTRNSIVALSNSKVFISFPYGNSYYLYGIICTIDGTSITKGTTKILSSVVNSGYAISTVKLNTSKVLVTHSDSNNHLYSMLCDIENNTITVRTDIQLSSTENSGSTISSVALAENKAFIAHSNRVDTVLYGMIQNYFLNLVKAVKTKNETINGVAITSGNDGEMVQVKVPGEE